MTDDDRRVSPRDGRPMTLRQEHDLNHAFAQAFSGASGKMVLDYLANFTGEVLPMGTPSEQLHYAEGRRALFAIMNQRIDDGRNRRPHIPAAAPAGEPDPAEG